MRRQNATPPPGPVLRAVLFAALSCSLLACGPPDPDTPFRVYSGLLGRALGVDIPAPAATATAPVPGARDLHGAAGAQPGEATAGIDILDLGGCALKANLVRSRSVLGTHAKPSQRLLLTLEYLRLARPCSNRLRQRGRDTLAVSLQRGARLGREHLPALLFEATLGSDEYRSFWQPDAGLREYPRTAQDDTVAALEEINTQVRRWRDGDYRAEDLAFELMLAAVAGGDAGALLATLSRQAAWLAAADRALRARDGFCGSSERAGATADALVDARRYFELELRPRMAAPARRAHALITGITALETLLDTALPPVYRHWREQRDREVRALRHAPARHLALLDRAIAACRAS